MSSLSMIFLVIVFFAVFGFALLVMRYAMPTPVQQRLQRFTADSDAEQSKPTGEWLAKVAKITTPFAKLSVPDEGWEKSTLRVRFMHAGLRDERAPMIYFGAKTLLAVLAPAVLWMFFVVFNITFTTNTMLLCLLLAASAGLYLPNLVLGKMVQRRQLEIFENFPNALDLMTVCIEAGLAIDAAIARVAQEMASSAPAVSEELHLVTLELRAGNSKEKALRNLAMRTGVDDVETLVSMLIQAERFGTSIADSLRVHAEGLRTKRRQKAEETAAKIALKLLFPLIFCIFPSLMLVLMGPAMIQIYRVLLPTMAGQ